MLKITCLVRDTVSRGVSAALRSSQQINRALLHVHAGPVPQVAPQLPQLPRSHLVRAVGSRRLVWYAQTGCVRSRLIEHS